ncbi:MAG: class I SAM-dependent methyltransferase [Lachnospiraceae bacterium]|nr:class I SAM-dependent methyltransferase [Lachnospiraceae bacterium]
MKDGKLFLESLNNTAPIFGKTAIETCKQNDEICSWLLDPLAKWSREAYGEGVFGIAAKGYVEHYVNSERAQHLYEKNGKYVPELFSHMEEAICDDEQRMVHYMWAAILTYPFLPMLVNSLQFFRNEFCDHLAPQGKVLELACGHGVMGLLAAEHREDVSVMGLDINGHAIGVANKLCSVSGHGDRASFYVNDALSLPPGGGGVTTYQGIIAAMLAEHLREPQILFDVIKSRLAPEGIVYFSTVLEQFQFDHVYEYNKESEPVVMAEQAGLRVLKLICDGTKKNDKRKFKPRALTMILVHQ